MNLLGALVGSDDDDDPPQPGAQTVSDLLDVLSNDRRRRTLDALAETDRLTLGALADRLAAQEFDTPDSTERKRVYVGLYQHHVPALVEAGLVRAPDDGQIALTSAGRVAVDDLAAIRESVGRIDRARGELA